VAGFFWLEDQLALHGEVLPPRRPELRPSPDLLALRYEPFLVAR
jgi:hypothetical protein